MKVKKIIIISLIVIAIIVLTILALHARHRYIQARMMEETATDSGNSEPTYEYVTWWDDWTYPFWNWWDYRLDPFWGWWYPWWGSRWGYGGGSYSYGPSARYNRHPHHGGHPKPGHGGRGGIINGSSVVFPSSWRSGTHRVTPPSGASPSGRIGGHPGGGRIGGHRR